MFTACPITAGKNLTNSQALIYYVQKKIVFVPLDMNIDKLMTETFIYQTP